MLGRHSLHQALGKDRSDGRPDVLHQDLVEFCGERRCATLREHRSIARMGLEEGLFRSLRAEGRTHSLSPSKSLPAQSLSR
jgi:hypothetical protein